MFWGSAAAGSTASPSRGARRAREAPRQVSGSLISLFNTVSLERVALFLQSSRSRQAKDVHKHIGPTAQTTLEPGHKLLRRRRELQVSHYLYGGAERYGPRRDKNIARVHEKRAHHLARRHARGTAVEAELLQLRSEAGAHAGEDTERLFKLLPHLISGKPRRGSPTKAAPRLSLTLLEKAEEPRNCPCRSFYLDVVLQLPFRLENSHVVC